ncbi:hypothetical protein Ccrd_007828 [Cynara cardunculus var. scolymus]|uniref:Uncharacterized protein n=1 Tax=Cynara cardunculus var. scolymus TaxID=59895 RepID=A0A103XGB1_CYNCS|nr:hypothetical protein Ccrd_007828 [Cynara cardunculus var. scolymus]
MAGTLFGIYVAQNYEVPDVKNIVNEALKRARQLEDRYRFGVRLLTVVIRAWFRVNPFATRKAEEMKGLAED